MEVSADSRPGSRGRVRPATDADVSRLAAVLAEAFSSDPPMHWVLGGPPPKVDRLRRFFEVTLPMLYVPSGEVWASEDPSGAAAWVRPGAWPFSASQQRSLRGILLRTYGRHPIRAISASAAIERGHPREPHWYLDYIGVEAAGRGRGAGSSLLAAMLERVDAENSPAYLNAGSERSRDLYERHGFEVTEEFRLPRGGPPLWRMWREPQSVSKGV